MTAGAQIASYLSAFTHIVFMQKITSAVLILAGIIHLLPLPGVLGAARLSWLYGLALEEPNLLILMRHRAVLFGLLGIFLIYAAFHDSLHLIALSAGLASVVSFVAIAVLVGGYNEAIKRVVIVDGVVVVLLASGSVLHFIQPAGLAVPCCRWRRGVWLAGAGLE